MGQYGVSGYQKLESVSVGANYRRRGTGPDLVYDVAIL